MDSTLTEESPLMLDSHHPHRYHPRTVSRIVTRIEALMSELLPIQVDEDEIISPTSSILTKDAVAAFSKIGGDFSRCVPFALLEARRYFRKQAFSNPCDSEENNCRKLACEALARKIVSHTPMDQQYGLLSARFTVVQDDGDESLPLSALESAVDQRATFFLSSSEAQRCVFALWRGLLVQEAKSDGSIEYMPYRGPKATSGFFSTFDPARVAVPRYQFFFRILLWVVFVAAYSLAIQTPDRGFGFEDVILYVQLLGYALEDLVKVYKIGPYQAFGFWTIVNFLIYAILTIAFAYRVADLSTSDTHKSDAYRLLSFQFLSSASPLIWMKLLTIFDLFQYFGTLQIVVWRMLKESAVFFTLLALLAVGFGQALTGLDVADDKRDSTEVVIHSLIQGLLGAPVFEMYDRNSSASYPFGMVLYYFWSTLTLVILLNILIALFGSAYQECTDEAVPTFMGFFAGKTIAAIRAPDTYVYVAPFNLVEIMILPLEFILSQGHYEVLNRYVMTFLFFVPLVCISFYETHFDRTRQHDFRSLTQETDEYGPNEEDPEPHTKDDDYGPGDRPNLEIAKVKFADLKKDLPALDKSISGQILWEVQKLREELDQLKSKKA